MSYDIKAKAREVYHLTVGLAMENAVGVIAAFGQSIADEARAEGKKEGWGTIIQCPAGGPEVRYKRKPVIIDAWRWDETEELLQELRLEGMKWVGNSGHRDRPGWVGNLRIKTLESGEGSFLVDPGDWIIRGVKGEFYACKPDIFEMTYDPVAQESSKP